MLILRLESGVILQRTKAFISTRQRLAQLEGGVILQRTKANVSDEKRAQYLSKLTVKPVDVDESKLSNFDSDNFHKKTETLTKEIEPLKNYMDLTKILK